MINAQKPEISADLFHHDPESCSTHDLEPDRRVSGLAGDISKALAMFGSERLTDRNQILALILQAGGRKCRECFDIDLRPDGLQIAPVSRPGKRNNLRACIVDIIFLGNPVTGLGQKIGQRVTYNSPAAVTDMHGPCRIGRDIFHIHATACTDARLTKARPRLNDRARDRLQHVGAERQIYKTGPCRFCLATPGSAESSGTRSAAISTGRRRANFDARSAALVAMSP